ncbi:DUF3108 domain-containing protein [Thalassotalea euphylliae]|uniref:DUF3108 domain-containing protein n=1 Tax=Thalassotalea euphylliae TaxID=1655234 RepID=A0A3E0TQC8_9GAMM|nr:DUF3108 domain-containing protein [Thalassotalea euphylliae]REL26724.1 DUF3108 domain-containing protein [Thalassotalea euphylliae]
MLKNWLFATFAMTSSALFVSSVHANDETSSAAQPLVEPFSAKYTILRKSKSVGSAVRELSYLPNGLAKYSYHTEIEWLVFSDRRAETSIVAIDQGKVKPTHYTFKREGTGKDKDYEWQYDIGANQATNVKEKRTLEVDFPDNIQDKLSYHLQNRFNLIANAQQQNKQQHFVYPVVGTSGKVKNYVYEYDGEEELMLPYGLVKTVRLKREVADKKRATYAWFAPELNYLMVKLYQMKGGVEQFQAQLSSVTRGE